MKNKKKIIDDIKFGTAQVLPKNGLEEKIESGRKLKIKLGMDPTAPDLHLGHAVVLSKLRQFQELGHKVIFLIGDFTARIGDPTGKSKTRPPLTEKEIKENTKTYFDQVSKILDPEKLTICYNSEWLDKLSSKEIIQLCGKLTLARLIEREDFANRIKKQQSVGLHELLYPLIQAYDSVHLNADIELGGTDQTFNMLLGRFLQEQLGQKQQVVITMPLLEGLDGVNKMSKSLGNSIGLIDPADKAYGKLMSISDELMWRYFELLLNWNFSQISQAQERVASGNLHPMGLKKDMAHDIIEKFWSKKEADQAQKIFESLFQEKDFSKGTSVKLPKDMPNPVWIVQLLKTLAAVKSSSEAKRLLEAGAVEVDGKQVKDFNSEVALKKDSVVKVGKHRIYKIDLN